MLIIIHCWSTHMTKVLSFTINILRNWDVQFKISFSIYFQNPPMSIKFSVRRYIFFQMDMHQMLTDYWISSIIRLTQFYLICHQRQYNHPVIYEGKNYNHFKKIKTEMLTPLLKSAVLKYKRPHKKEYKYIPLCHIKETLKTKRWKIKTKTVLKKTLKAQKQQKRQIKKEKIITKIYLETKWCRKELKT